MNYLEAVVDSCEGPVYVEVNPHKGVYETVEEWLGEEVDEISPQMLRTMKANDSVVTIQAYPYTPEGFYKVHHYSFYLACVEMFEIISEAKEKANG